MTNLLEEAINSNDGDAPSWSSYVASSDMRRTIIPNSTEYRRYAEVARQVAKEEQGSRQSMWIELALFWDHVADYIAAEEAQLPRQGPRYRRKSRL